jgi:hypothetical protein
MEALVSFAKQRDSCQGAGGMFRRWTLVQLWTSRPTTADRTVQQRWIPHAPPLRSEYTRVRGKQAHETCSIW